ncbi:MAG TPA: NAD-dependent deacylase [candidate division Zixibacteria bacterium]|nr:NAD-dependent deacylase [candidate division Zixibacteria bacterium]HEQ99334.1 NAD-dependent deacylase [candidate division Zixibacteria bacterium]
MFSETLIELLKKDPKICVLTGAGVSAESGVPTFRGKEGIWKKFRAEELATVDAFLSNPELVLAWYQHRRDIIDNIEPNPGHYALAKMEKHFSDFCLVTQNVDALHRKAGSEHVLEVHGNIMRNKCLTCGKPVNRLDFKEGDDIPRCECGGMIRPDVVWFGEMLPADVFAEANKKSFQCELFLSIGTSAIVYPAAGLPIAAKQRGAYLVEINVQETELSTYADEVLLGPSGEILPKLLMAAGIDI